MLDFKTIPPLMVTDDLPKKKIEKYYKPPTPELIAYLDFSVSTTGVLSGVKVRLYVYVHNYVPTVHNTGNLPVDIFVVHVATCIISSSLKLECVHLYMCMYK